MVRPLEREELVGDPVLAGLPLCRAYSDHVDAWLADLYAEAQPPAGVSLIAVGGYGRAELSPQSDIDLLLLHQPNVDVGALAERLWYPIWDEGLKLGHSVRTAKDALALASDDLDTATSLLSMRHLAGDAALTADLAERALALWRKRAKRWLSETSRRVQERHRASGEVAFLLEPDLKEGRGGLRDVHSIRWADMAQSVMFEGDDEVLAAAYDVLLSVRVELHRRTGRPGDRLVLREQDSVAEALGYTDANELMRAVSTAARSIAWRSDEVWFRIESSIKGPTSIRLRRDKEVGPGIVLRDGTVALTAAADIESDPHLVLRTAVAAARAGVRIERRSLERLAATMRPGLLPWNAEARGLFADLLLAGPPAVRVVEALDQLGIWVQLLPEWEMGRCKPQRNAYHTYTVDRHLAETAANAASLADRVDRPDLLVVGALLHDIGKGYPGDHTEVGIDLLDRIGHRMGYEPDEVVALQDMVRHHLLLPDIATRRDITDDGTLRLVANQLGDVRTLRLLGALTEADSLATGPAAWNSWKAQLVDQLVERTAILLGGGTLAEATVDAFPTDAQLDLMTRGTDVVDGTDDTLTVVCADRPGLFSRVAGVLALNGLDVLDAAAYSNDEGVALSVFKVQSSTAPVVPWERVLRDLELSPRMALAARLAERARVYHREVYVASGPITPQVKVDNDISDNATVIEVHAPDAIGVLYRITRAIAELELNIVSAKVQTMGHEVVDSFYLRDTEAKKVTEPAVLAEVERAILHVLTS
jgi:[protein-PII] uridylyltransferase